MKELTNKKSLAKQLFEKLVKLEKQEKFINPISTEKFKPGDEIYEQDKQARAVYYIAEGLVKLVIEDSMGKESVVRLVEGNEFCGMLSLVKEYKYTRGAIAITEGEVYKINTDFFIHALSTQCELSYLFSLYTLELIYTNELKISELIINNVEQRLATVLINHLQIEGDQTLVSINKKNLAMMCGTIQETLSRKLALFSQKGLIKLIGRKIIITDLSGLKKSSSIKNE
jgi:CRP/FNR family transcriptional regulator